MPAADLYRLLPYLWRVILAKKNTRGTESAPAGATAAADGQAGANASGAKPTEAKPAEATPASGEPDGNSGATAAAQAAPEKPSGGESDAPQITSLVSKVIELANAGVGLGINLVSLLSTFAKAQVGGTPPAPRQEAAVPEAPTAATAPPDAGAARSYCIVNRVPLHSGGPVKVSFSINNDLPDATQNLVVTCRGFAGAAQSFRIADSVLSVEPAAAVIGPMDFERFVLQGTIPAEAPADTYNGWIQVGGDEQIRIPAVLVVSSQRAGTSG